MACLGSFGTHKGLLLYVFSCKKEEDDQKVTLFSYSVATSIT